MQIELTQMVVSAVVQMVIGAIFYFAVQRTVEKVDKLQEQVTELKDKQLTDVRTRLEQHAEHEAGSRKGLYERVGVLEKNSVSLDVCREQHRELREGQQEFRAAVIDLSGLREKIDSAVKWIGEVNERQIAVGQDLAEVKGKLGSKAVCS